MHYEAWKCLHLHECVDCGNRIDVQSQFMCCPIQNRLYNYVAAISIRYWKCIDPPVVCIYNEFRFPLTQYHPKTMLSDCCYNGISDYINEVYNNIGLPVTVACVLYMAKLTPPNAYKHACGIHPSSRAIWLIVCANNLWIRRAEISSRCSSNSRHVVALLFIELLHQLPLPWCQLPARAHTK
jgi:hypothetical protein